MNNKNIGDAVRNNSNMRIGKSGMRLAVAGTLVALASTLYAIMPRDPDFYNIHKGNIIGGHYKVPVEYRLPVENQKKAAGVAFGASLLMLAGFAMHSYSIKGKYNS